MGVYVFAHVCMLYVYLPVIYVVLSSYVRFGCGGVGIPEESVQPLRTLRRQENTLCEICMVRLSSAVQQYVLDHLQFI